ncbi:MAG: hypothetical protein GY758_13525, partial [Fuerstiella sp.]|nr:hypothetical protein [Fuerstiella sp.]
VQFCGITGPITLSGTATATTLVNLYGVSSSLADSSVNTTVTDSTQSATDQTAILADTNDLQTSQGDWLTATATDANLIEIEGHALAGTSTQIADGFEKFFNVATPTKDMNDVGVAGAGLTAADVWTYTSGSGRILTAGTNLNDVSSADVTAACTSSINTAALATAAELAKVPKSDSTVSWNATALAAINAQCDTAVSDAALGTAAELAKVPKSDGTVSWNATALAAINSQCDTAISDASLATAASIAALNDIAAADVWAVTDTEQTEDFAWPADYGTILAYIGTISTGILTQTDDTTTYKTRAGAAITTHAVSDDGTTFTSGAVT